MRIISDSKGNQLLEIMQGYEYEFIRNSEYQPLTSSLVIVKSSRGFMLLKNRFKHEWELAGGIIEDGETPLQCAIRECMEESGYAISNLRFVGMLKFLLVSSYFNKKERIEYTMLYCANIETLSSFIENEEMSDLCWYNVGEKIENASEIDLKLLEHYID
jgi:8-oxo-dGTP diphosphatase